MGDIDHQSQEFPFIHSAYYEQEMGPNLMKQFVSFHALFDIEEFVSFKLWCVHLESEFSEAGKRRVNIDPAYLELAKLVVGTRKNFDHRIYLGSGVYGDVQLRFRKNRFVANDWTYPDYQSKSMLDFLTRVRSDFYDQLKQESL